MSDKKEIVYAVVMASYDENGNPLKNTYTFFNGPFYSEEEACVEKNKLADELYGNYGVLDINGRKTLKISPDNKTSIIYILGEDELLVPKLSVNVVELNLNKPVSYKLKGNESPAKGANSQKKEILEKRRQRVLLSQISALCPPVIGKQHLYAG